MQATPISVVIITHNESAKIAQCIKALKNYVAQIIVIDSGSTDDTLVIAQALGAQVHITPWQGYGNTKNWGHTQAQNNWVLSIDADEVISPQMGQWLQSFTPQSSTCVYAFRRKNYIGNTAIKFGTWGTEYRPRLFNTQKVQWNNAQVHEELEWKNQPYSIHKIEHFMQHFTLDYPHLQKQKIEKYAALSALKYYTQGKKATWVKRFASPIFSFVKGYIIKLGFLDGALGYHIAKNTAYETWLKYQQLHELRNSKK
jgi:glycosyltransferase involved in cell wall biosynthesis